MCKWSHIQTGDYTVCKPGLYQNNVTTVTSTIQLTCIYAQACLPNFKPPRYPSCSVHSAKQTHPCTHALQICGAARFSSSQSALCSADSRGAWPLADSHHTGHTRLQLPTALCVCVRSAAHGELRCICTVEQSSSCLCALSPDAPCQLDVLGHDGHTAYTTATTRKM